MLLMRHFHLSPALLLCAAAIVSHAQPSQAQDLDVGSNSSSVTTNFTSGTNTYNSAYIGFTDTADNNALNVFNLGTVLNIRTNFFLGSSGSSNTVTISNGASVTFNTDDNYPAFRPVAIGSTTNATGNILLVTGTGSSFSAAAHGTNGITLGDAASGNSVVISNGGSVTAGRFRVGNQASASNNTVLVTGSGSVLEGGQPLTIGNEGSFNSITVSNGGRVIADGTVGVTANAFGNSVLLTGPGTTWSNVNSFALGERGSGNSLTVSDGAVIIANGFSISRFAAGATNNTVLVTGAGSTMNGTNASILIGESGSGVLTVANGGTLNGDIILAQKTNSSGVLNIGAFGGTDSAGSITASSISGGTDGQITASGGLATVNFNQTNTLVLTSTISGFVNVNQLGASSTILLANNFYDGKTTISAGGLLALGNGGTSGGITGGQGRAPGPITNNGTLQFNRSDTVLFRGVISGSGALLKSGTGRVLMLSNSSYTGPTTVEAGNLSVFGSIASSTVTVDNGGTLSGSGTVGGIVLNLGGTLSPGASPGTITVTGNSVWNPGANYNWQIYDTALAAGTGWDLVNATGTLDLSALSVGSEFNVNLWSLSAIGPDVNGSALNFDPSQNYTWTILTAAGGISGFTGSSQFDINIGAFNGTAGFANGLDGGSFFVAQNGNDLNLVFTAAGGAPIPEPGTWAAAALLVGGVAFLRWRKRKQVA